MDVSANDVGRAKAQKRFEEVKKEVEKEKEEGDWFWVYQRVERRISCYDLTV